MIADVPLGAFLSGGIDSSAVVAAMAEAVEPSRCKTFSIGFDHEALRRAAARARRSPSSSAPSTRSSSSAPDAVEILPKIVRHYGEPFADSSAIPSFYLAELTRRHVTVALNGDGGDESFAGYTRYVANALAGRLDAMPAAAAARGRRGWRPAAERRRRAAACNRARRLAGGAGARRAGALRALHGLLRRAERAPRSTRREFAAARRRRRRPT